MYEEQFTVVFSLMEHLKVLGKISLMQKVFVRSISKGEFGAQLLFEEKLKENKPRRTNQIEKEDQHMEHPPNFVCTQIHSPLRHHWPNLR